MRRIHLIRKIKRKLTGFTLIELLVVVGILSVILAITLIAINPLAQFNKTNDVTTKAITNDFITSNIEYFTSEKSLPWQSNTKCLNEISTGGVLSDMPDCIEELTKGGRIKDEYMKMKQLEDIYVSKCGSSAVLCYNPKSKEEYESAETHYTKFGVNDPGCPGHEGPSDRCYWCRPVFKTSDCDINTQPPPSPTSLPSPTMTPTPTPNTYSDLVPGYGIDQSKFFRTYAVYFFDHPGFPPSGAGWNMQISTKSDFTASYPDQLNMYGIPSSYSQDAPLNTSYAALRSITSKYVGLASIIPYDFNNNHCGQTIYWRITNFYSPTATDKKYGPTYTGVIDCTTKVNVVDPPLSWYTVFDQAVTNRQKQYDASWDFDKNGVIDWTDYWLGAFSTKVRAGGWQPPE